MEKELEQLRKEKATWEKERAQLKGEIKNLAGLVNSLSEPKHIIFIEVKLSKALYGEHHHHQQYFYQGDGYVAKDGTHTPHGEGAIYDPGTIL